MDQGREEELQLLMRIAQAAADIYDSDDSFTMDATEAERAARRARDHALGEALEAWKAYRRLRGDGDSSLVG